ncbi:hypothetical protein [Rhizobium leguminosarum]|uniref:hypothetical protein n=1 Tax=Rhizobium leguminosarum TaxID=384 RepID=UPI0004B4A136|nr:hypothetical protein [Rhizobium leguminosarum]
MMKELKRLEAEGIAVTTIDVKEYIELLEANDWLLALESAGVDNWQGYDFARECLAEIQSDD